MAAQAQSAPPSADSVDDDTTVEEQPVPPSADAVGDDTVGVATGPSTSHGDTTVEVATGPSTDHDDDTVEAATGPSTGERLRSVARRARSIWCGILSGLG